jgi:hypothetical protein
LFAGNAGEGVHVNTVSPALHVAKVVSGVKGLLRSRNVAAVTLVSIGSLNVKTTAAEGETPVAPSIGTVETSVGTARAGDKCVSAETSTNSRRKTICRKKVNGFIRFTAIHSKFVTIVTEKYYRE